MRSLFNRKYELMTTEQIKKELGNYCESQLQNQIYPKLGNLRTFFNVLSGVMFNGFALVREAAVREQIRYTGHDTTLVKLAESQDNGGSPEEINIKRYASFLKNCWEQYDKLDTSHMNKIEKIKSKINIAKSVKLELL